MELETRDEQDQRADRDGGEQQQAGVGVQIAGVNGTLPW
jgi:hypothetical protein